MKILVADDDFASRCGIVNYLRQFGDCDVTVDGNEAVEAFAMAQDSGSMYDLVCLDADMPVLDGYGAYKKIRELESSKESSSEGRVRIIVTTAYEQNAIAKKSIEDVSYVAKPINFDSLKNTLTDIGLIKA